MRNFRYLLVPLALVGLVGCNPPPETLSKSEIERLNNPALEPPPGATMGPPPGTTPGPANSLDPKFKPKGEVQKY